MSLRGRPEASKGAPPSGFEGGSSQLFKLLPFTNAHQSQTTRTLLPALPNASLAPSSDSYTNLHRNPQTCAPDQNADKCDSESSEPPRLPCRRQISLGVAPPEGSH